MKKAYLKKAAIFALAGLMMAQTALTGCGKKTVDYDLESNANKGDNSGGKDSANENGGEKANTSGEGGISGRLGIPEGCNESLDVGASTLSSISINDDEIEIPDTDKMNIVHFKPYQLTKEDKKRIAEALFEKDKGIYLYDYENRIKADIQEQIDRNKEQIKSAEEEGDSSWTAYLEAENSELEKELASAPDEYPAAGDYDGNGFLGMIGDVEYSLSVYNYEEEEVKGGGAGLGLSIYFSPKNSPDLRPKEGFTNGYMTPYADKADNAGQDFGANMSSMTSEEAEDIAANFLADIGITDVVKAETSDLYWTYYNGDGEEEATEADGYSVIYSRAIAGSKTYSGYIGSADNLQLDNGWVNIPTERFSVYVYDGKVVEASWEQVFGQADSVEENVELLSYEQILEKANTEMAKYYEKYPTRYKKIDFNDVRLTYYLVSDGDGKCKYIPVWVFSQYEERTDYDGSESPEQIVILNAMDGTFIDIIEESKALGCYQDYSDMGK